MNSLLRLTKVHSTTHRSIADPWIFPFNQNSVSAKVGVTRSIGWRSCQSIIGTLSLLSSYLRHTASTCWLIIIVIWQSQIYHSTSLLGRWTTPVGADGRVSRCSWWSIIVWIIQDLNRTSSSTIRRSIGRTISRKVWSRLDFFCSCSRWNASDFGVGPAFIVLGSPSCINLDYNRIVWRWNSVDDILGVAAVDAC